MSHRKFEAPRHGHLGFLPRKRCTHPKGKIGAFPKDDPSKPPHLTGFMGFKAGMTHVVREVDRVGAKLHGKEIVEGVTVIDTPPIVVVGVVGYVETAIGLKTLTTVWAQHIGEEFQRRLYKNWYRCKKKRFSSVAKKWAEDVKEKCIDRELERMGKYCSVIRVICHTQPQLVPTDLKKAHIFEIQVNGGDSKKKVEWAASLLEKKIPINSVFEKDEMIDFIGVNKGKGFEGVVTRWGVTRLPRKTHKGLRKVACIGAWHPANIQYSIARAGQMGYHHRTEINKKVFRVGKADAIGESGSTDFDLTKKSITPMGGFKRYGIVKNDFLMVKGSVLGNIKQHILIRKSLLPQNSRKAKENVKLKFIDTSSKVGTGRFQTSEEKKKMYGPTKKW